MIRVSLLKNRSQDEQGIYLPLMAFIFIVLLGLGALALDGAKLYRANQHLQRAADAAVIGGIGYRILKGPCSDCSRNSQEGAYSKDIEDHARQIALSNLIKERPVGTEQFLREINFVSPDPNKDPSPAPFYDYDEETLTVKLNADISLFLMHVVPFSALGLSNMHRFVNIEVIAKAELKPAYVALVLDVSNSMDCSNEDPGCECLVNPAVACASGLPDVDGVGIPDPISKLDYLKNAVIEFNKGFREGRDYLSLVPFNIVADVRVNMRLYENFDDQIMALSAKSNTNTSDAIARAFLDARQVTNDNEDVDVLLFTDGAPNAGRFTFPPNDFLPEHKTELGRRDYIAYSVLWQELQNVDQVFPGNSYTSRPRGVPKDFKAKLGTSALMKSYLSPGQRHAEFNFNHEEPFPKGYFGVASPAGMDPLDTYPECSVQYNPGWAHINSRAWRFRGYQLNMLPYSRGRNFFKNFRLNPEDFDPGEINIQDYRTRMPNTENEDRDIGLEGVPLVVTDPLLPVGHPNSSLFFSLESCLNQSGFSFHQPMFPSSNSDELIGGGKNGRYSFDNYDEFADRFSEQFYSAAIAMADTARQLRFRFHVVGLGQPAFIPPGYLSRADFDPFQDAKEVKLRKDLYLTRLAVDPDASAEIAGTKYHLMPGFRSEVVDNLEGLNLKSYGEFQFKEYGTYIPTEDPEELVRIFNKIRRKILIRLTNPYN